MADIEAIISNCFDETNAQLRTTVVAGASTTRGTTMDLEGILSAVYDEATQSLRVIGL